MTKNTKVKLVTGLVRFANVHIYRAMSPVKGVSAKYSLTLIIPKSDIKTINSINLAFAEVFRMNQNVFSGKLLIPFGLKDGDAQTDSSTYSDYYYLSTSSSEKPGIVDHDLNPLIGSNDLCDGCYGRASVTLFAYSRNGNAGITAGLNNVQKLKDPEENQESNGIFPNDGGENV
jgi:hypothetical protein